MFEFCSQCFTYCGVVIENERCPNAYVRSLGYIEFYCHKIVNFFWVCRLRVDQTSKWETSLQRKSDR